MLTCTRTDNAPAWHEADLPNVLQMTVKMSPRAMLPPACAANAAPLEIVQGMHMKRVRPVMNSGTDSGIARASRAPTTTVRKRMLKTPKTMLFTSRNASTASAVRSFRPPIRNMPDAAYLVTAIFPKAAPGWGKQTPTKTASRRPTGRNCACRNASILLRDSASDDIKDGPDAPPPDIRSAGRVLTMRCHLHGLPRLASRGFEKSAKVAPPQPRTAAARPLTVAGPATAVKAVAGASASRHPQAVRITSRTSFTAPSDLPNKEKREKEQFSCKLWELDGTVCVGTKFQSCVVKGQNHTQARAVQLKRQRDAERCACSRTQALPWCVSYVCASAREQCSSLSGMSERSSSAFSLR